MKSKTYQLPMYDELGENAYNTSNRIMTNNLGIWLLDNYQDIGTLTQDQEQEYQDIANKASEASWSDFNRQLAKAQDTRNAASYNRFGSLTNTPALYDQETFGRESNKAALELANNITDYYNTMVNQDIGRQLYTWNQYSKMYNTSGDDITKLDKYNWNIRNKNLDRQYQNDVAKFNNRIAMWQGVADLMDPLQSMMKGSGGGNSGSGLFDSFNKFGGGNSMQGFTDFMNNRYGAGSFSPTLFGQGGNNFMSSLNGNGMFDSALGNSLMNIDTSKSGWLNGISSSLGSSGGSGGGSWLSSIGSWFKGLGGK